LTLVGKWVVRPSSNSFSGKTRHSLLVVAAGPVMNRLHGKSQPSHKSSGTDTQTQSSASCFVCFPFFLAVVVVVVGEWIKGRRVVTNFGYSDSEFTRRDFCGKNTIERK
jgi:hypothetical protein